jgi:diaminohydroxyphosphoribosylaminopyrimidine deaminase/5-amino-6-(5-phosphoribosylamino)uracil reductase
MGAALALASRGQGLARPNPSVGCVLVHSSRVVGRGWTQRGGRPHAEAIALAEAGPAARGATAYVTLEPCAHQSTRGPACTHSLIEAGVAEVVVAAIDPDPRTHGKGLAALAAAGIRVSSGIRAAEAEAQMAGFFSRHRLGRPHITLKLALSLDGSLALADGTSRWITGDRARAHAHLERARTDLIVVGQGTLTADRPSLDVRLPGLEARSPARGVVGRGPAPEGWLHFPSLDALTAAAFDTILVEGGAGLAASLLRADLVDRLLLYRAPLLLGGRPGLSSLGLAEIPHGLWQSGPQIALGADRLETFTRNR